MIKRFFRVISCFLLLSLIIFPGRILAQNGQVLAAVKKDGKWGYIDTLGKTFIPFNMADAGSFNEGLAAVKYGGGWGYINKTGIFVLKPVFTEAGIFHNGHAKISFVDRKDSGHYTGYVNRLGLMTNILEIYETGFEYHDGLVRILSRDQNGIGMGYKDSNDVWVIKPHYDAATDFHEGLAGVVFGNFWGYIDQQNNMIIPQKFKEAFYFQEHLANVVDDNGRSFIDQKGNKVFSVKYDEVDLLVQDGMICFRDKGKIGFLNKKGKVAIHPQFEGKTLTRFQNGLAPIEGKNGKFGFINKSGKFVIEPQFDEAQLFFNNYAIVKINGKYGYIDKKGNWAVKPEYDDAKEFEPADY